MSRMPGWLQCRPRPIVLLGAAAPVVLFPQHFPPGIVWVAALLAVLSQVGGGGFLSGRPVRTPIDIALAVFCLMSVVGTVLSPVPAETLPKATGLLFGVASLRLVVQFAGTQAGVWRLAWVYVALGWPVTAIGLLATAWNTKVGAIGALAASLPIANMLPGRVSVNANALAAAVLCFLPLLTMLCVWTWRRATHAADSDRAGGWTGRLRPVFRLRPKGYAAAAAWIGTVVTLILTQSRTGWVSAGVTLGTLAAALWLRSMRSTRNRVLAGAALIVLPVGAWTLGLRIPVVPAQTSSSLEAYAASTALSIEARRAVWANAVRAIRDFPVTGVGLGAFRRVIEVFYPLYLEPQDVETVHAHNQALQVALDVGLPGLVAYLAVLLICVASCARVFRDGDEQLRTVALGLTGNLLAMHIFGLTDAIAPGAKLGWFLWLTVGLAMAADRTVPRCRPGQVADLA